MDHLQAATTTAGVADPHLHVAVSIAVALVGLIAVFIYFYLRHPEWEAEPRQLAADPNRNTQQGDGQGR